MRGPNGCGAHMESFLVHQPGRKTFQYMRARINNATYVQSPDHSCTSLKRSQQNPSSRAALRLVKLKVKWKPVCHTGWPVVGTGVTQIKYNKEKHLTTSGEFYQLTTQTLPRIPALRLSSYPSTSKGKIAQTLRPRVAVNYQRLVLLEVYGLPEHNNTTTQQTKTINILAHIEHPPGFVIKRRISQLQMDILIDCEVMVFRVALGESFWGNHEGNIIELCLR